MECPSCGSENRTEARFCDSCGTRLEAVDGTKAATSVAPPRQRAEPLPPSSPEAVGAGRYTLEAYLGESGRKHVYLARDPDGAEVAIAIFSTSGMAAAALARVRREARAVSQLGSHPHIVGVLETGEDGGRPWIASEYMAGGDLKTLLSEAEAGRFSVDRALAIAADVAQGLEHAHSRGIVHRDLKPATVWLDSGGSARLGDFGLASTGGGSGDELEGMLVGTVAYLPPEQALGRAADARSDVYSLGAVIYEMVAGQPPFPGQDAVAIIGRHLNAAPVAPSRHNPEVPRALDELVLAMLAKPPSDRPQSAAVARAELEQVGDAGSGAASDAGLGRDENPLDGLAGGVFVGREAELEELRSAVDEAVAGRGRLLLLVGEPGIGKTRTAEELATYARVRGARVHWGRCHEGEGAPAYWPWAEAIRSYAREADPVGLGWEMGERRSEIAAIVPELAEGTEAAPQPPPGDAEQARFRLFDAVASFLYDAARERPLVLVLDDLHWADESSLSLLRFVSRRLGESGLLIVGTYRDVELGRHHPLAQTLAEMAAVEQATRVTLRGLDAEAIEAYVEMTSGSDARPGLAGAIFDQTEGNPFFVGEVVRLLASEGALEGESDGTELAIPQGVREVIGRRLDGLSDRANSALTVAAAIGRRFDLSVLELLLDDPRADLEATLEEAVEAQVVRASRLNPGQFVFSHALVRETLYAEITAPRRVQLHGEIGEALERIHSRDLEPHLAELAYHFIEAASAGDAEKAIGYAERAAARATAQLAHEDAAAHYERALEIVLLDSAADRRAELDLRLELGASQTRAGRFAAARETREAAAGVARELGDQGALTRAALGVSDLTEAGAKDDRIVALLTEALEAVGSQDSAERARILAALAQEEYWEDPQGQSRRRSDEALAMARRVDDPGAIAAALTGRQFLLAATPQAIRERLENADELLALSERSGDREMAVRGHAYRLTTLLQMGDVAAVDRELDAYTKVAEALRQPRHLWHVPIMRATRATMAGRFDEARTLSQEGMRMGQRAGEPISAQFHAVQMALLHVFEGSVEEMLPPIRQMAERYPAIVAWRMALVSFLTEAGKLDEARAEFERLAANDFEDLPVDTQWIPGLARVGEAAARLGDVERSSRLYELLAPFESEVVVVGRATSCNGPVTRYLGLLARTLGRTDEAVAHLEAAVETVVGMGDRPWATDTRVYLAAALLERDRAGDRDRALGLLGSALEEAQELGMRSVVERAIGLRLRAHGVADVSVTTSIDSVVAELEDERPDLAAHAAADGRVTILFSDIENSTLMTERLGDERWIELLREHNGIFRERLRDRGGYEVKNQGDGFMLAFPDSQDALSCAIEIQRDFAELDAREEERIRIRMGLHAGEAIVEEGDFFGRTVILAARIAAQARGGEVLVSEAVHDMAESDFDDGRELELKGLAGSHRVYLAEWEAEPAAAGGR